MLPREATLTPAPNGAAAADPNANPANAKGQGIARVLKFTHELAQDFEPKLKLAWWNNVVTEFFTPQALMKMHLWKDNQIQEAKSFGA